MLVCNTLWGGGPGVVELGTSGREAEEHKPRAFPRGPHGSVGVDADGAGPGLLGLGAMALEAELHKPRATPRGPHGSVGVEEVGAGAAGLELGAAGERVLHKPRGPQGSGRTEVSADDSDDGAGRD
jgi:hypothetical protein